MGIFWSRLGTPTSTKVKGKKVKYLSGSVEEIERSIKRWESTEGAFPIIHFYRRDEPVLELDHDIGSYAAVINYFQKFEAGGVHGALYIKYKYNNFRDIVRLQ